MVRHPGRNAYAVLAIATLLGCRGAAPSLPYPGPERGGFVVTLGNDTISAESFTRTGNRIDGMIVRRSPRTVVVRYVLTLLPSGRPARLEFNTRLPDGSM